MTDRSRRLVPFDRWPNADRVAWECAITAGDILDGHGPAAHWSAATRRTNLQHYGRWLAHLLRAGTDLDAARPAQRVTPEVVRSYIAELKTEIAPRTVVSSLVGLKVMIKALAPDHNWRWLADVCNALDRSSLPRTDKRARMRDSGEIYAAAINELQRLSATPQTRRIDRVAFRDTLMLALAVARPIRLKNLTNIRIGQHLIQVDRRWLLTIPGNEVKNGQPLEFTLPPRLTPYLNIYLGQVRPTFLAEAESDVLWLTFEGVPLDQHSVYCRFILVTTRLFGVPINPHLLRDCAATTLSTASPALAQSAAALLGHRSFATTERHYIRANQLEAGRTLNAVLSLIKNAKG